jgi:hypothetical protein
MLLVHSLSAQTNTFTSALAGRYLLIVEISRAMQPRAAGAQRAVRELLASGMNGQLRRGDTLGVWSFNESLYTGKFPLQKWSPETKDEIAVNIANFLAGQKCEKNSDFNQVAPALEKLVSGSDYLTVILVTDGEQKVTGTPFNGQINEFFQLWRDQQRKAQMPFLTVLRASHGEITHYTLNTAPWTVQMPPLAPEIQALAEADRRPAPKVQTSSVPPLIIHGKRPSAPSAETAPAVTTTSNTPTARLATNTPMVSLAETSGTFNSNATPSIAANSATNRVKVSGQQPAGPRPTAELEPKPQDGDKLTAAQSNPPLISATNAGASSTEAPPPAHPIATADPSSNRNLVVIAGLVLGAGVLGFAIVWLRRSRTQSVSLITRSIEREKQD